MGLGGHVWKRGVSSEGPQTAVPAVPMPPSPARPYAHSQCRLSADTDSVKEPHSDSAVGILAVHPGASERAGSPWNLGRYTHHGCWDEPLRYGMRTVSHCCSPSGVKSNRPPGVVSHRRFKTSFLNPGAST